MVIGKETHEFLVSNTFGRFSNVLGQVTTRVALTHPQPLVHGKTAAAIVGALLGQWRTLRQLGHLGFALEVYCFDRCSFDAIVRCLPDHHYNLRDSFGIPETLRSPYFIWLQGWV